MGLLSNMRSFFSDKKGNLSMSRLLCFLAFFPASYVVIETKNSDTLGWYLGAYVAGYVGGKFGEMRSNQKESE